MPAMLERLEERLAAGMLPMLGAMLPLILEMFAVEEEERGGACCVFGGTAATPVGRLGSLTLMGPLFPCLLSPPEAWGTASPGVPS